jgi:hypothetical protein
MHPLHDTGNIARLSNDPIVGLPAAANWPIRPWPAKVEITPLALHHAVGHDRRSPTAAEDRMKGSTKLGTKV